MAESRKRSDEGSAGDEARRLAEIVLHAAALETGDRARYLEDASDDDPALVAEARRRLRSARNLGSSFLAAPAGRLFATPEEEAAPEPEPGFFPPGTLLDERYRVVNFLGQGGMGVVYRADDLKLGEPVALKLLPPALEHDAARWARLLEEARIARKITHENVCRVHDVGEAESLRYLSMEYIDGEDLASLVRRIGRLPQSKAREIGLEICAGLAAAHHLDILHRDLKPSNIMLDGAGRTRITDFGLAGIVGTDDPSGSPAYLAPERWDGVGATVRSELYALGLVLYELFTGRPAFREEPAATLRRLHREISPPPPSRWLPNFDPKLESLILRCLEKDPERRPATVEEVAEVLERTSPGGLDRGEGPTGAPAADQADLDWRPAPKVEIPGRPHWVLSEKLGEGGFGDVWLAAHRKTGERRVFKFCYDSRRLRFLKREITLFRLLKEELGERDDITRILDWSFDRSPFYVESEYTAGGNLLEWAERRGGIERVPLATRLELVAQVAEALAAAHSIGVLHKDVKPSNVLITEYQDGVPRARLTDFGIGLVLDRERLAGVDFTVQGMTGASADPSPDAGTRLYLAPELMEGRAATVQADVYSLGAVLYQLVVGDLSRALAPGWRREVDDELLRADVAEAVDGVPERRLRDARLLAERLRSLDGRRSALETERRRARELERARRRRRLFSAIAVVLLLLAGATLFHARRTAREAERANREAEAARLVSDFMVDLFEVSSPSEARGNTVTAREILDRGAETIRAGLDERPLQRARLLDVIGSVYLRLGLYDRASPLLDEALEARRRLLGDDHPDVAASLVNQGALAIRLLHHEEAESLYRRALEIQRAELGPDHPAVIETLGGLGFVYLRMAHHPEAQAAYREALELAEKVLGPNHPEVVSLLNHLAHSLRSERRFAEAEPLFQRALALGREVLGSDHPQVAILLTDLGDLYYRQGRYIEAEEHYRRSLALKERIFGPEHPEVAITLNTTGELLSVQGHYDEAEVLFLRSQAISEQARDPSVAYAWYFLGKLYRKQGRYAEAEELLRRVLESGEARLPADHLLLGRPLRELANVYRDQGRYAEAESLFQRTLAILEKNYPPGDPRFDETYAEYAVLLRQTGREDQAVEIERRFAPQ